VWVLFTVERAVFNTLGAGALVTWRTGHAGFWLACGCATWIAALLGLALRGAARRPD
jgi:hypothetical protein